MPFSNPTRELKNGNVKIGFYQWEHLRFRYGKLKILNNYFNFF